jgi:hypothetical protein
MGYFHRDFRIPKLGASTGSGSRTSGVTFARWTRRSALHLGWAKRDFSDPIEDGRVGTECVAIG